jgi:hypothetical protein
VIRNRTAVLNFAVELVVAVPESWSQEDIESHYNEGPWCGDNLGELLGEAISRAQRGAGCLCGAVSIAFVREATPEDERAQQLFADTLPA